ncbi:unnamed protein product, partial [Mesorhabditis belari]|uniref:Uncharacterized protein n=1 Tax=Mesorhabditis belari TaxID=2138241 RepID=A0AAF3J5M0_9BILA
MRIDDNFMKSHTHRLRVQLRDGVLQGVQTNELKEQIDLLQQEIEIFKEEGNNDLEKVLKGDIYKVMCDLNNKVKKDLELCEDGLAKVQQKLKTLLRQWYREVLEVKMTVNGAGVSHIEEETPEPATAQEVHSIVAAECPGLAIDELINADAEKIAREIAKHATEVAEFNKDAEKENNRF